MTDALAALRLQLEWGADESLGETAIDRFAPPPRPARIDTPREAPIPVRAVATPQADTLEALYDEWDAFASPLRATATHTVRPDGNPRAGLVLIGDTPGSDDDRSGRAFSGAPGQLLDRVFQSAGLGRETMLLTTLVPWRPPGSRPLAESEIQSCLPFVRRLLAILRPHRLVLVGAAPVRALTGETGAVRRLRGRFLSVPVEYQQAAIPALALPAMDQWLHSSTAKQQLWSNLITLQLAVTPSSN